MTHMNPSIKSLLHVFAKELKAQLAQGQTGITSVTPSDSAEPALSDFVWWSSGLSFDPSSRILLGASPETWETLFAADELAAQITPLAEHTARSRFGSEIACLEAERSEAPAVDWTSLCSNTTQHRQRRNFERLDRRPVFGLPRRRLRRATSTGLDLTRHAAAETDNSSGPSRKRRLHARYDDPNYEVFW